MHKFIIYTLFAIKSFVVQAPVPIPPTPPVAPANLTIAYWGQSNAGDRGNAGSDQLDITPYASYLGTYSNTHYIDNLPPFGGSPGPYETRGVYTRIHGSPFGSEIGIVANVSSSFTNIEIIKYFVGGTALQRNAAFIDFNPKSIDEYYNQGFYKYDVSSYTQVNLIPIGRVKPDIIIWIQGEQDANLSSNTYANDLDDFAFAIRRDFNDQNIPIFYNQLHVNYRFVGGVHEVPIGVANVRAAQASFQSSKNIMINMDDVAMGDTDGVSVHYSSAPLAEMGKRFATAIKTYYSIP